MLGFQTLSCLHDIPVVRSSTNKLQDVYTKAKDTSVLIRLPCNLAETVADKSLKIALTVVNPLVKPLFGPVRVIDDYAAQKIRQIESKYPAINTPTEEVVNTFNEKTEPVRHVMNSVKDTTTSTIQHGKETVSNVATATVNKASGVADSVFSFCETHVPGIQRRKITGFNEYVCSSIGSLLNNVFQTIETSFIWFRMLVVFFLLKIKQTNDIIITKLQQKRFLTVLPQRLLIIIGTFLDYFIQRIKPTDRTLAELKKTKQQSRLNQQPNYFMNRQNLKVDPSIPTRINNSKQQPDYSNMNDKEELYARLVNTNNYHQPTYDRFTTEHIDNVSSDDIEQLHAQIKATDIELLYSRLPEDVLPDVDNQEPLNEDQQQLHARIIGAGLERQGYEVD